MMLIERITQEALSEYWTRNLFATVLDRVEEAGFDLTGPVSVEWL
jgi:hypothetical protein